MRHVRFLLILLLAACAYAKETPIVTVWPSDQQPVLRFSFGKFNGTASSSGKERFYNCEVTTQNLWGKRIEKAQFSVYFFSKDQARIGEGYISLTNLGAHETVKFTLSFAALGVPASFKLNATEVPQELQAFGTPRTVNLTIYSVPPGATLKVDGNEVGTTPKMIQVSVGKHELRFSKEGYNAGTFPLEVKSNDLSGGTLTYELGNSAHDTVELRDGTTLTCDVESMSATEVVVHLAGKNQTLDRNQVKRILLVPREPASPTLPNASR